jgi:hypothetical protein
MNMPAPWTSRMVAMAPGPHLTGTRRTLLPAQGAATSSLAAISHERGRRVQARDAACRGCCSHFSSTTGLFVPKYRRLLGRFDYHRARYGCRGTYRSAAVGGQDMSGSHSHGGGGSGGHSHGGTGSSGLDFSATPYLFFIIGALIGGHFLGIFVYKALNNGYAPYQSQMGPMAWFYTFFGFAIISGLAAVITFVLCFLTSSRMMMMMTGILLAATLLTAIIAGALHNAGRSEKASNPQNQYGSGVLVGPNSKAAHGRSGS